MSSWIRGGIALVALLGVIVAPVELQLVFVEHPVVPPPALATALTISSCLLLVWSGLGLRRTAAGRHLRAGPPAPGA